MEETERAGIATFVMRGKEYLVAILAENGILRAETLRFADELRTPQSIGLSEPTDAPADEVARVVREMKKLYADELDVSELEEQAAARLERIVKRKLKAGKDVVRYEPLEDEASAGVIDLMERLQRSLRGEPVEDDETKAGGKTDLEQSSKSELYEKAKELDIPGRSSMTRTQLIEAIRRSA